jgi:hypothetical protein
MTNPTFTGSTADAPYGFKADGTPYKRDPEAARAAYRNRSAATSPTASAQGAAIKAVRAAHKVHAAAVEAYCDALDVAARAIIDGYTVAGWAVADINHDADLWATVYSAIAKLTELPKP